MFTLITKTRRLGEACRMGFCTEFLLFSEEMGLNTGNFGRQSHAFDNNKFYSSLCFFFCLWHLVCFSVLEIFKVPMLLGWSAMLLFPHL